jgi:predicted nuclease with TOPRIM domain
MTLRATLRNRIDRMIAWRVDQRFDDVHAQLGDLRGRVERIEGRLDELGGHGHHLGERLDHVAHESSWSANELARLAPQVAAFETRLEQQARPQVYTGELADLPEARLLVDVVREEHARVRARLALVSAYEERLRRLEQQALAQASR